ncbi:MAG TPA: hypothetical protein VFE14_16195, partial [Micromonosporaceae bacterium]|nr:hypothetical protein [Micromonosporaceae bacterium]
MTVRDRLVDLGVVAAAAAGIEVTIAVAREAGTKPPGIAGYLLGIAMALPLLARRSHPVAAVFATSAVLFVYYAGNAGFPTVADRSAGLARLPALVSAVQAAGLTLSVQTAGQPATLPSTVDHAAYRILQEALTNVL